MALFPRRKHHFWTYFCQIFCFIGLLRPLQCRTLQNGDVIKAHFMCFIRSDLTVRDNFPGKPLSFFKSVRNFQTDKICWHLKPNMYKVIIREIRYLVWKSNRDFIWCVPSCCKSSLFHLDFSFYLTFALAVQMANV